MTVRPGTVIVTEGERSRGLFTVCDGWAIRYHRLRNGSRQILDVMLPGDGFAQASVIGGSSAHAVEALTAASICMVNGRQIVGLLKSNAGLAFGMLQSCLEDERRADAKLTMLGRMSAEEKIGYFMIDIYDRLRRVGLADGMGCPFPLRRADVADAVGLSKVHVLRALGKLRARALMEIRGRTLLIPDVARLADYTGYVPA